jgi:predicted Holliday junction resolvase-like endonuclease
MSMYLVFSVVGVGIAAMVIISVVYMLTQRIQALQAALDQEKARGQRSAITQRAVVKGQLSEQLYPLLPSCPYPLQDMKFLGQPFDYLVLKGYADGAITEVVFVDVKTGNARLSPIQRTLRDCITAGHVSWHTATITEEG